MSKSLVKVYITPKQGVLDPQGKAVQSGLKLLGVEGVSDVRLGKYIELTMEAPAPKKLEQMCERLLANTVIEDYRYEIADDAKS